MLIILKTNKGRKVAQIDIETKKIINIFDNSELASEFIGCSASNIQAVCRGDRNRTQAYGYNWKYIDDDILSDKISKDEKWIDIKGYENLYKISNYGRVYSYRQNKIMSLKTDSKGYHQISLYKNSIRKEFRVHILVATNFIKNNNQDKDIVNHKDGNKKNNYYKNLEWTTHKENIKHAIDNKLLINDIEHFRKRKVAKLDINTNKILKIYNSIDEASKDIGCHHNSITKVCKGNSKTCKGYKWKYI